MSVIVVTPLLVNVTMRSLVVLIVMLPNRRLLVLATKAWACPLKLITTVPPLLDIVSCPVISPKVLGLKRIVRFVEAPAASVFEVTVPTLN